MRRQPPRLRRLRQQGHRPVTPLVTRYLTIEVTAEDIALGKSGSTTECPVALAARSGVVSPFVDDEDVSTLEEYDVRLVARGTKKMRDFISRFDDGLSVKPTTFRLRKVSRES